MTADRVPKFGDRIMVRESRNSVWIRAVWAYEGRDFYEGFVLISRPTWFPAAVGGTNGMEWRWPEPGEWEADDE